MAAWKVNHGIVFWLGIALLLIQAVGHADPELTERIEWDKTPIQLNLKVGHERMVHFPGSVKVGVPASLQPLLRTQSVDGTVYFLANAPFDATRVMVRRVDGGQIVLFDVSASKEGGQTQPLDVFVKSGGDDESSPANAPADDDREAGQYGYVALTRFAAQQLYAPARLVRDRPGIVRIPVPRDPVSLVRGGGVDAVPLVAWRSGGLYVTAVKLTNRTAQPQALDARDLRGTWLAATFQHNRLLAAGSDADTTAVYLISALPFEASR
jgi:integrating conjugative element protein (TIGR03749 family)